MSAPDVDLTIVRKIKLDPQEGRVLGNKTNAEFPCPKCGERKFHVNVDRSSKFFGFFHCFRSSCEYKGRIQKRRGREVDLDSLRRRWGREDEKEALPPTTWRPHLPEGFVKVTRRMSVPWMYLRTRGIPAEDIPYYKIGISILDETMENRVIFPDYDEHRKLCYWVARRYDDNPFMKYRNMPIVGSGRGRQSHIFNLGRFIRRGFKDAILVEGPITGIVAGRNHLALLGMPSEAQVEEIAALGLRRIYMALDPDLGAKKKAAFLARHLVSACDELYLVPVPEGHDAASLGRKEFTRILEEESVRFRRGDRRVLNRFVYGD